MPRSPWATPSTARPLNALAESLERDPHPMVRGHVAWALGRIGSPKALAALRRRRSLEQDGGVRSEIEAALKPFGWVGGEREV